MSKIMELTPLIALRLAGDPALYNQAPFLEPMKSAAMMVAAKYGGNCTQCQKAAQMRAGVQVAYAMAALILAESGRPNNKLAKMKAVSRKILNTKFDKLLIRYTKHNQDETFEF